MRTLEVRSPTRVDLVGGTLDLWPIYAFVGGATTIQIPISIYTCARLTEEPGHRIRVSAEDVGAKFEAADLAEFLAIADQRARWFQVLFEALGVEGGFHLHTRSESPVGGGLGGSSSLLMSCLKALLEWEQRQMAPLDLIRLAHNIEARALRTPTGTQDYVPACFSKGINIIEYALENMSVSSLTVSEELFTNHFLLVYTGRSHHSGLNNWDVMQRLVAGDQASWAAISKIQVLAAQMRELLNQGRELLSELSPQATGGRELLEWHSAFGKILARETEARLGLSEQFASPEISELTQLALSAGADAVKICGAGGGGCVFIWTPAEANARVKALCQQKGYQVLGAQALVSNRPA